ncbi:hypothetical protein ON010_g8064 [Phytophthora cinnamomi]|nr:hypothetical protein ON010_g8064 [Phytophthora cinnamomi]
MPRDGEDYRNMDQQQFDHRRAEDEARQDALLDQIHGGVVGLKNHAHAINGEVVEQNIMIDDIGNGTRYLLHCNRRRQRHSDCHCNAAHCGHRRPRREHGALGRVVLVVVGGHSAGSGAGGGDRPHHVAHRISGAADGTDGRQAQGRGRGEGAAAVGVQVRRRGWGGSGHEGGAGHQVPGRPEDGQERQGGREAAGSVRLHAAEEGATISRGDQPCRRHGQRTADVRAAGGAGLRAGQRGGGDGHHAPSSARDGGRGGGAAGQIIPGGSGNGLSASLLSRASERFEALNAAYSLAKGQIQELDLFTATNGDGKIMHGFLSLEWAFIADMDIKSERYRFFGDMRFLIASTLQIFGFGQTNFPGRLRYLVSKDDEPLPAKYHDTFSSTETTAKPKCVCLEKEKETGGEKSEEWEEMEGPFYMFWSMNVSHAAADAHIAPPADISDGYFYLMLVSGESYSRMGLAKLMMGIEDGSHLDADRVQLIRTRAFTIHASNASDLMCVDGELFPGPEVKIEVHRALGRVLCLPGKNK